MGLAHKLWRAVSQSHNETGATNMARTFAMPYYVAESIFYGDQSWLPRKSATKGFLWWKKETTTYDRGAVTPDMVADQIDLYLVSLIK